jgi:hypothetical protein
MNPEPQHEGPQVVQEFPSNKANKRKKRAKPQERPKPGRVLPTIRIAFEKQLAVLRAYAAASADGTKAVQLKEVSSIAKMVSTTLSMVNTFISSIGLIQKTEAGFVPAPEVLGFFRAYDWNKETAAYKLSPIFQRTWFAEALLPKLSFESKTEEEAVGCLAEAAPASPEWKKEISLLLDFLQAAGLIRRESGRVYKANSSSGTVAEVPTQTDTPKEPSAATETQVKTRVLTTFAQSTEGTVNFNVSVRVNMEEFGGWPPERIAAFFSGIAQVLAAKSGIEKEAGK